MAASTHQGVTSYLHNIHAAAPDESKQEIIEALGDLTNFEIFGSQVLIGVYCRPAVTKTGFKLGNSMQLEDVWQGKVGLILKLGPDAFDDAEPKEYGGAVPKIGDWIFHKAADAFQINLRGPGAVRKKVKNPKGETENARDWDGWPCRLVYAADIYGRLDLPHIIV